MKHKKTILIGFLQFTLILLALHACDKHEMPRPEPTLLTSSVPGLIHFSFEQHSHGLDDDLVTDSLFLIIKNQSSESMHSIDYAIRGFSDQPKDLLSFSYWDQGIHKSSLRPHQEVRIEIHNDFHELLPSENLEVDLISYMVQGEKMGDERAGSYAGDFKVIIDSLMNQAVEGLHMTWIDYAGNINVYFDCESLSWCSFHGKTSESGSVFGKLITRTEEIELNGRLFQPNNENEYRIYFDFDHLTDTLHNYQFSLMLNNH